MYRDTEIQLKGTYTGGLMTVSGKGLELHP